MTLAHLGIRPRREAEIQRAILQFLGAHRVLAYRSNTGAVTATTHGGRSRFVRFGVRGMPDITGVLPGGRALYIEVKAPGGRCSPWQIARLAELAKQGAVALVATGVPEVAAALRMTTTHPEPISLIPAHDRGIECPASARSSRSTGSIGRSDRSPIGPTDCGSA